MPCLTPTRWLGLKSCGNPGACRPTVRLALCPSKQTCKQNDPDKRAGWAHRDSGRFQARSRGGGYEGWGTGAAPLPVASRQAAPSRLLLTSSATLGKLLDLSELPPASSNTKTRVPTHRSVVRTPGTGQRGQVPYDLAHMRGLRSSMHR